MADMTTVQWDLSGLFKGVDDPRIDETLDSVLARSKTFAQAYRGRIDSPELDSATLHQSLVDFESISSDLTKIGSYAALVFSADTSKPEHGALMQHIQERQTEIAIELIFFDLELMAAPNEVIDRVTKDEILADYRHFITAIRLFREHRLPESEEKILEEKANTGSRAWDRLFDEVVSDIVFNITINGEEQKLTEPEILALMRDPDREVRRAASVSLTEGLVASSRVLTFIFNTLIFDKAVDDRLRSYEYPEQYRNISNELDRETVETVVSAAVEGYPLVERFYRTKRDILGLDKLYHYDRYAPLFEAKKPYTFDEAKDVIMESFGRFSPVLSSSAEKFFTESWIDAEPRKGKRGGAFCMYVTPDLHPYVLLSYLNRVDDIMTLGHELGHGVHAYLSRKQNLFNFSSALPVAELASTFGEMLVFENLSSKLDLGDKLALYAEKIEGIFATIFRQASMYRFEQDLHRARREQGELTKEEIGELWQRNIQSMFGDSLELGEEHRNWWMYVSHFIGSPFYVYAYTFGELLVMALYSMYKEQGEEFVPKYIKMLETGGSCSPQELLSRVGIDIHDPNFWRGGLKVVEKLIADFEALWSEYRESSKA